MKNEDEWQLLQFALEPLVFSLAIVSKVNVPMMNSERRTTTAVLAFNEFIISFP
jgi:hypothetical protein